MADIVYTIDKPQERREGPPSPSSSSSLSSVNEFPCVSCLDDTILPQQRKLPDSTTAKLTSAGRVLAIATLIFTITVTAFAFFISKESDSSATLGFAFDSFLALISSCILIWRFSTTFRDVHAVSKRETQATAVVALCMVVSSALVFARSLFCLYHQDKPEKPLDMVILATISFIGYFILSFVKYRVAQNLGSGCLLTDAVDSLCGAIFAFSILVSAIVLNFTTKVWFLDSSIGMTVSVCSFAYGLVVVEKLIRVSKRREMRARREYEKTLLDTTKVPEDDLPPPYQAKN